MASSDDKPSGNARAPSKFERAVSATRQAVDEKTVKLKALRMPDLETPPPSAPSHDPEQKPADAPRIVHDARGNAVWDFAIATGLFALESTSKLLQRLESPSLSIDEEASKPAIQDDKSGGYDPYNRRSGRR